MQMPTNTWKEAQLRSLLEKRRSKLLRYHLAPVRRAVFKNLETVNAGEGVEKRDPSHSIARNVNWITIMENSKEKWKWKLLSHIQLFETLPLPLTPQSSEFSRPEYWSGILSLLQGIFPTQESNPRLPHCRQILYQLSHQGSPRRLEWVAYPFSRGSSRPWNRKGVSCIAGRFFTNWAMREARGITRHGMLSGAKKKSAVKPWNHMEET